MFGQNGYILIDFKGILELIWGLIVDIFLGEIILETFCEEMNIDMFFKFV